VKDADGQTTVIASIGDAENARPENDGQRKLRVWKMQEWKMTEKTTGSGNAGFENDGQNFSQLWAKLRGLENAVLENDGQHFSKL